MPSHTDRDKRRTVFCQTAVDLKNWETGKEKLISCGIPDTYVPTFYIPEEGPVLRVVNNRPEGIVLVNLETQITCPEALPESFGDPVTIPLGLYFFNINYEDIPDITEDQLHFIASLDQDAVNMALSNADFSVLTELRLSAEQQEFLVNEVAAGLEMLIVTTNNAARGILRCRYTNDPRTECCPDKFFVVDGELITECLTIEEGQFLSSRSKEDANATANNVINAWLAQCVTGNDPDGKDPEEPDEPDCPAGFINTSPSVDIPAGSFVDYSKKEANKKARAARRLLLNCEICNDAIIISCPEGSITEPFVIAAGEICANSDAELQELIAEAISTAEACEFENDRTFCSCRNIDPTYDAQDAGVFKFIVNAGLYSAETKEEANILAMEECLAELECYWQNDCVPKCPVIVSDSTNPGGGDGCKPDTLPKVEQPKGCAVPPGKYISDISKQDANEQAIEERGECPTDSSCSPGKVCLPESYLAETDQPTSGLPCKIVKTQVQACPGQNAETEEFYYCGEIINDGGGGGGDDEECPDDCECMTKEDAINSFGKDKFEFCAQDKNNPPPCGVEKANRKAKTPARIKFCVKQKKDDPKDKPCLGGCACMTADEAAKAFKKPQMCGEGTLVPCGVVVGDPKKGIPDVDKFCYKEESGDDDPPPPPPSDGCPSDCICGDFYTLQSQNPGKEITSCSAEPTLCGEALSSTSTSVKMCYKIGGGTGGECSEGCICSNYRELREKYPDAIFETCNGETTYCGGLDPVNGEQINMCYKDPGEEPKSGGCSDGGTGSLQSKGSSESTPTDHLYWENGCVKTNGNVVITDKDVEPQVKVSSAQGMIKIEGNGVYIPAQGSTPTEEPVEVKDGLVTNVNLTVEEMMICEYGTVKTFQVVVMKSE